MTTASGVKALFLPPPDRKVLIALGLSGIAALLLLFRVCVGCAGRPCPFRMGRGSGDQVAPRLIRTTGLILTVWYEINLPWFQPS